MSRKPWNGVTNWSSHPCPDPAALNRQSFREIVALMAWDARLCKALARAKAEYIAAGSPGIPILESNYRRKFK